MSSASTGTTARAKVKGNRIPAAERLASAKALQRLYREIDRVSMRIPFDQQTRYYILTLINGNPQI